MSAVSTGRRAALVMPRSGGLEDGRALQGTLDSLAELGWTIAAILDPKDRMQALRMVVDGLADVVVATAPEHFPELIFAGDLRTFTRPGVGVDRRTRQIPRPAIVEQEPPIELAQRRRAQVAERPQQSAPEPLRRGGQSGQRRTVRIDRTA